MRNVRVPLYAFTFLVALVIGAMDARADTVLLQETNFPGQAATPISLQFTADATSSTITFEGYQVASIFRVTDINLTLTGGGPTLLGKDWTFTAAASGSNASQIGVGLSGVEDLGFAGQTAGSYDAFSQSISTVVGDHYTLSFVLFNNESPLNQPSGLIVSASDVTAASAPEPGTLVLLCTGLAGFGGISCMRKRKPETGNA